MSLLINLTPGSGVGSTTLNDGLKYGSYPFGTRVQDERSLNVVDCNLPYVVYQSNDYYDPVIPSMTTGSLDGPTSTYNDLIIGDQMIGRSRCALLYFAKKTDTSVEFIYMTNKVFTNGEVVKFVDSGVRNGSEYQQGSRNIIEDYIFLNGQTETFYDQD